MSDPHVNAEHRANGSHYQPGIVSVVILVVLFVGAAFVMLRSPSSSASSSASSVTTTTSPTTTTTSKSTRVIKSQVRVQVANGTLTTGLAGSYTQQLQVQGWNVLAAANGPTALATVIYYNPGYLEAAKMVASSIHVSATAVRALGGTNLSPLQGYQSDDIIVLLGPDAAVN